MQRIDAVAIYDALFFSPGGYYEGMAQTEFGTFSVYLA